MKSDETSASKHSLANDFIISGDFDIEYVDYTDESMLSDIQRLVAADLSEPYSIFTYRYFLHTWPNLCICVYAKTKSTQNIHERTMIGTIVSKAEFERDDSVLIGYIAMLAINSQFRRRGIGQKVCCQQLRLISIPNILKIWMD